MSPLPKVGAADDIVLVTAADETYSVPLSVTIRSALDCLDTKRKLKLFVLDGGISEKTKARLMWSWIDPRLTVEWIRPNIDLVRDLPVTDHISIVAYVRLLMPELLPASVSRIIYVDSDMLIRRDLAALWDETPQSHPVFAVQEYAAPFFDSSAVIDRYESCQKYLAANNPIPNFRELGLSGKEKYFNSGLLVINLAEWRRKQYANEVLACLRKHRQHILWWDQYALNVVFAGAWGELDKRWNQGAQAYVYPNWIESPFDQQTFQTLRNDPWIVHFCSPSKPWHYFCQHPRANEWRRCLRQTDFRNWKPDKPDQYFSKLWRFYYEPLRQDWTRRVTSVKQTIGKKHRSAA